MKKRRKQLDFSQGQLWAFWVSFKDNEEDSYPWSIRRPLYDGLFNPLLYMLYGEIEAQLNCLPGLGDD